MLTISRSPKPCLVTLRNLIVLHNKFRQYICTHLLFIFFDLPLVFYQRIILNAPEKNHNITVALGCFFLSSDQIYLPLNVRVLLS